MAHVASPEGTLVFAEAGNRAWLSRQASSGRALRLASGVYVTSATLPPEAVAQRHRWELIAHYWPGAVLCGKTALAGGEPVDGVLYVAHPDPARKAALKLPGLTVEVVVGPAALPGDMSMPCGLHLSGSARQLVENIHRPGRPLRSRAGTLAVEDRIDTQASSGGAGRIQNILGQLDVIAGSFDPGAVEVVRSRLAQVLGTHGTGGAPVSERLRARLHGQPYDQHRIDLVEGVVATLQNRAPTPRHVQPGPRSDWLAFYEAYFSNYIEGTQFSVDEARAIAIDNVVPTSRPADAHDVAATFRLTHDPADRQRTPRTGAEFLGLLQDRHSILMAARQDKRPGEFKDASNYAGGYRFTEPDLVQGTLLRGFDLMSQLVDPFARAVAMMVLVTEVHPFDDGNGRVARLMVNAELTVAGQARIVIPTVYRNNYLAALGGVSNRAGTGQSLISTLEFAQRWTQAVDWSTFEGARAVLERCNAFMDAGRAEADGFRLELPGSIP